jgi:hypothetical protein
MFTCRGIAFLSAILTTFSLHLSVLGTHTLINSFISPFLFLSLDFILKQIITSPDHERNCEAADTQDIQESFLCKDKTKNNGYAINGDACDINSNHKVITESNPVNNNVGNVSISKRNNPNGQSLVLCVNVISTCTNLWHHQLLHLLLNHHREWLTGKIMLSMELNCRKQSENISLKEQGI